MCLALVSLEDRSKASCEGVLRPHSLAEIGASTMSAAKIDIDDYFGTTGDIQIAFAEALNVQNRIRRWIAEEVQPHLSQWWQQGRTPDGMMAQMAGLGIFETGVDPKAPGERRPWAYGLAMQELERADSGLRTRASVQCGLVMHAIARFGDDAQRATWLSPLLRGETVGGFALTEAGAGSNPKEMACWCQRKGEYWLLEGNKRWVTNADQADLLVVWAKERDTEEIRGFIVPTTYPGVTRQPISTHASMRLAAPWDVGLSAVRLPVTYCLAGAKGLQAPLACITQARYAVVWGTIGAALDCFHEAMDFTQRRISFGRSLAHSQMIQELLVDMQSHIVAMELRAVQLARLAARDQLRYPQVALAKRDNARAALSVARIACEILAAKGFELDSRSFRHMANLESVDTYEGTYAVQTLIVGRDVTGLSAF